MGMSTHIVGFRPPDEQWKKMKAAYDACKAAGLAPSNEVDSFFNGEPPDASGTEISELTLLQVGAIKAWRDDMREGFEVDVTKLPKDLRIIRFYNSY